MLRMVLDNCNCYRQTSCNKVSHIIQKVHYQKNSYSFTIDHFNNFYWYYDSTTFCKSQTKSFYQNTYSCFSYSVAYYGNNFGDTYLYTLLCSKKTTCLWRKFTSETADKSSFNKNNILHTFVSNNLVITWTYHKFHVFGTLGKPRSRKKTALLGKSFSFLQFYCKCFDFTSRSEW